MQEDKCLLVKHGLLHGYQKVVFLFFDSAFDYALLCFRFRLCCCFRFRFVFAFTVDFAADVPVEGTDEEMLETDRQLMTEDR